MQKLPGEFVQQAVVFFAAVFVRVVYGLVLGLPSFFLFGSWWLDFLIFGIAGTVACSMSIHPPGMRWTQSLLLFGVTVWLITERLAGRHFLPPVEGAEEAHLPMWRNLMAAMYAFSVGPVLRLALLWSMEWDWMARRMDSEPDGRDEDEEEPDRTTIRLWDIASGRQRLEVDAGQESMARCALSLDGKLLASPGNNNRTIKVWDTKYAREFSELAQHPTWINGFAFSSDATLLTSVGDGSVRVWDVGTGELKRQDLCDLESHDVAWTVFSRDGSLVALGDRARSGYVWDIASGEILFRLQTKESSEPHALFSPDGTKLALIVGRQPRQVYLWDVPSGGETLLQTDGWSVASLAFSDDGKRLASAEGDGHQDGRGRARVWDVASGRELMRFEGDLQHVGSVAFSPNGRLLATGERDDHAHSFVRLWALDTGRERLEIEVHTHSVDAVAFSPDGRRLAAAAGDVSVAAAFAGTVGVWEVVTGKLVRAFDHPHVTHSVAFSPDGRILISQAVQMGRTLISEASRKP